MSANIGAHISGQQIKVITYAAPLAVNKSKHLYMLLHKRPKNMSGYITHVTTHFHIAPI